MPSASTRLNRLLRRGFYPAELPPTFRTNRFNGRSFSFTSIPKYSGSTLFFDGATYHGTLRTFGVINPINYFLLSNFIADHWSDISKTYRMSMSSGEKPTFSSNPSTERGIDRQILTRQASQRPRRCIGPDCKFPRPSDPCALHADRSLSNKGLYATACRGSSMREHGQQFSDCFPNCHLISIASTVQYIPIPTQHLGRALHRRDLGLVVVGQAAILGKRDLNVALLEVHWQESLECDKLDILVRHCLRVGRAEIPTM